MPALVSGRSLSALLLAFCAALSGCGSFDGASLRMTEAITPYKVEVVQGNFVASEQLKLLAPGQTRAQVRDLLGTPMVTSIFHGERWDYTFSLRRKGIQTQSRRLTVFFKGDVLDHVDSDPLPTEAEFVASLDAGRKVAQEPVLEASPDSLKAFAVPTPAPAPKAVVAPLPASYPPLEEPKR
jgi:outer membrane protein assembly factor BamE